MRQYPPYKKFLLTLYSIIRFELTKWILVLDLVPANFSWRMKTMTLKTWFSPQNIRPQTCRLHADFLFFTPEPISIYSFSTLGFHKIIYKKSALCVVQSSKLKTQIFMKPGFMNGVKQFCRYQYILKEILFFMVSFMFCLYDFLVLICWNEVYIKK